LCSQSLGRARNRNRLLTLADNDRGTAVGGELLFEVLSRRYERGSTLITSNLPFDEWTSVFGSERLTGALLDRLTHHVHILEMNGESFRLASSRKRQKVTEGSKMNRWEQPSLRQFGFRYATAAFPQRSCPASTQGCYSNQLAHF
jgi:hypothetical protein